MVGYGRGCHARDFKNVTLFTFASNAAVRERVSRLDKRRVRSLTAAVDLLAVSFRQPALFASPPFE